MLVPNLNTAGVTHFGLPPAGTVVKTVYAPMTAETQVWFDRFKDVSDGPRPSVHGLGATLKYDLGGHAPLDIAKAAGIYINTLVTRRKESTTNGSVAANLTVNPISEFFNRHFYSKDSLLANTVIKMMPLSTLKILSDSIEAVNSGLRLLPPGWTAWQSRSKLKEVREKLEAISKDPEQLQEFQKIVERHLKYAKTALKTRLVESLGTLFYRVMALSAPVLLARGDVDWYLLSYMFGVTALMTSYTSVVRGVTPMNNVALIEHYFQDHIAYNVKPVLITAHNIHRRFTHDLALQIDVPELHYLKALNQSLGQLVALKGLDPKQAKVGIKQRIRNWVLGKKEDETQAIQGATVYRSLQALQELERAYTVGELTSPVFVEKFNALKQELTVKLGEKVTELSGQVKKLLNDEDDLITAELIANLEFLVLAPSSKCGEGIPRVQKENADKVQDVIKTIKHLQQTGSSLEEIQGQITVLQHLLGSEDERVVDYLKQIAHDFALARDLRQREARPEVAANLRQQMSEKLEEIEALATQAKHDLSIPVHQMIENHTEKTFLAGAKRMVERLGRVLPMTRSHFVTTAPKPTYEDLAKDAQEYREHLYEEAAPVLGQLEILSSLVLGQTQVPQHVAVSAALFTEPAKDNLVQLRTDIPSVPTIKEKLETMRANRTSKPSQLIRTSLSRRAEGIVKLSTNVMFAAGAASLFFTEHGMLTDFVDGLVGIAPSNPHHADLAMIAQGRLRGAVVFPLLFQIPLGVTVLALSANGLVKTHFGNVKDWPSFVYTLGKRKFNILIDSIGIGGAITTADSNGRPIGEIVLAGVRLAYARFLDKETKKT